jgi:hypothetical protein
MSSLLSSGYQRGQFERFCVNNEQDKGVTNQLLTAVMWDMMS